MRTKIDKDVKKKEVVERDPGDSEERKSTIPPKVIKKVKKPKKVDVVEDGHTSQEVVAPEVPVQVPDGVCGVGPDEVEAAVNSITEPCEVNNVEAVSEQVLIENHIELAEDVGVTEPDPHLDPVPDLAPDPLPVADQNEADVKEVEQEEVLEVRPKTPDPVKKAEPVVANYCTYDSVIEDVARGDIIVTTPPRKPPKKRRNDDCKSKEKLNFGNSEKQKKSVVKKKVDNSNKKTANPVIETSETSENGKEQSSGSNEQTGDAKTNEAGAKSRSKRTPKKRKFHDEQEDERAQVSKAKVIKKPSTKAKTENTSAKPSESQAEKTVSPKSKKSPKSKTKTVEESKATNDVAVGEKKEETEKVKKVKKEKSAKKSKKVSASKCSEEKVEEGATKVIPPSQENAQCSSDSGIGGTDSEMKLEGTVDAPVANATCVPSENGLPTKMETDGTEPSEQKPVEPKKKSKSSKPKKPKDSSKEKVNGLTGTDDVDVKEDLPEKVKTPKKSKAKKRKSEEGKAEKSSEATETKSEEQTGESDKPKEDESSAAGDGNQTDKPSPKKKKKKIVENGEGEVKKVVKKKKKVVKKPAEKEKENGEVGVPSTNSGPNSPAENGPVEGGSGLGDHKPEVKKEGESPEGDDSKEGSDIGDDESPEENRVKINKEKKVLETRECSLCGHKTRGLAALTRHMKRAHQIISKPPKFKCDRCEFDAAKRAVYAKHMLLHDVIMCSKCPYICSSNEALDEHVTEEHKNKGDLKLCRLCNRYVRCPEGDSTLEKHMEDCKGKVPLICKECYKEFKYESGLKIHISTHYPDQPKLYTCELCSYQSNYKANLHKHIQNIHQEREKTIKCQECDKMFYKEEHMRRHLRLHSENRPYNCEKCEKTFKSLCAMRNHMESHNPGRPFKCEFDGCTKSFRTAKFLKNHVEESHQMGEKRYHCSTEGCKFSFFKKSHLKRHEITHTGERNYHCTWQGCGKSFRHSDNLKVHQRQHTNEKPIKCSMCNFSCRQRNSLQWHIKRHHVAKEGSEVSRDGSQSGVGDDSEPKVNGVATPAASSDPCASVKSDGKGIDLYEFNDDDFCEELPVVFRREKPRFHVLTREDLDQLHEAAKSEPVLDPLPDWVKEELEAEAKEEIEKEIKKEEKKEKESPKEEPAKTPPKKKKKKVVASKKTPPKLVKKARSPKAPKAPKSPKTPASPRTPKSPKSQGTKKKGSPETAKKKTVATKKKVSPQSKKAAASKKKSPAKKKETKSKAKAPAKKAKSKKVAKEEKKQEEPKEEEEKEIVEEPVEEPTPQAEPEDPVKAEVAEEPQPPSPQTLQKPQSPQSDGSSPSPHSPHSDRSEASPLLSDNDSDGEPQRVLMKDEEKVPELEEEMHMEENPEESFQEPVPDVPEISKEEAMSPGQAQQEAIDRSLEENPIIDDSTLKDNHSQQDMRQYSPGMTEEVEGKVEENEQIEDEEEQRVSSDDEVTNDILLTPPRAPAPPPPQSPSEEEEEEEVVMQPVQSPVPVSVPLHEPLSHPEPMSNQPMSQDPQQPLPSVEPPKDEAQPPQPPAPQSAQYPHPTTTPECDKDYLGQYLQDLSVPANSARDSVPEEPNRLQRLEELAEKPHEDSRDIPRAASVASNVITHTSMQPFHDMSHKRMEILACDRSQEQHFQRDTASALPRLPDPPPFDSFNPLNSIHSVSRENNFLRQNENIFSTQATGSSFMRLGDSEAMRQRMSTPFLPQNDRTAISRLPDTTLRPTNPALLRRPTTMPSTDMFPPPAMTQTMPRNPFTNTWSGQEVRPPHWPQAPYLQRTIDRQPNATPATLFAKENYLASRDFMFDPSRTMTERNMFASLSSPQPQRELAPETFPLELSYFGSHAYSGTATLDYSRPPCGTAPKAFDERYRQTASSAMSDFRGLPQTSSTEMFSGIGVNSSFNLDKYMYTRDPVYHPQHVGENTNSAFLTHSTPTQHSVFDREYPHRSLYPHQNTPYPFLEERQYSTAAKLTHTAGPSVNQERDFMPRSNTAENPIPPDPYRCGMLYNVMNRYSFE